MILNELINILDCQVSLDERKDIAQSELKLVKNAEFILCCHYNFSTHILLTVWKIDDNPIGCMEFKLYKNGIITVSKRGMYVNDKVIEIYHEIKSLIDPEKLYFNNSVMVA